MSSWVIFPPLVLLVLISSSHACNARSLGVLKSTKEKDDEKLNGGGCVSMQPPAERRSSVAVEAAKGKSSSSSSIDDDQQKNLEVDDEGDFRNKWRVLPHTKTRARGRGDRETAGFYLQDYLPPKTHPPLHN